MKNVGYCINVDWVVADFGLYIKFKDRLPYETEPTSANIAVYKTNPQNTVKLFELNVEFKCQTNHLTNVCRYFQCNFTSKSDI